jgi:transcriptional regulator with XRE-family HTH domain
MIDPALSIVLRRFRKRIGMTQEDLAYESRVTISALLSVSNVA